MGNRMFDYDTDSQKGTRSNFAWGFLTAGIMFMLVIAVFAPKRHQPTLPLVIEKPHDYNIKDGANGGIVLPMPKGCEFGPLGMVCRDHAGTANNQITLATPSVTAPAIVPEPEPKAAPINPSPEESTVPLDIPAAIEELHEHIHERIHEDAQAIVRHVEQDVTEAKSIIHRVLSARRHIVPKLVQVRHVAHRARHHYPRHAAPPPITYFYDPAEDPSRFPYVRYWVE